MIGLKTLLRLRPYVFNKLPKRRLSYHTSFNEKITNIYFNTYIISFVSIFGANICLGIYDSTVIEKPFGNNCPCRNLVIGMITGTIYGFSKAFVYSFGSIFFWLNAWYEHYNSDILDTNFGKIREYDIRYHFLPGANLSFKTLLSKDIDSINKNVKNIVPLFKNLGILV